MTAPPTVGFVRWRIAVAQLSLPTDLIRFILTFHDEIMDIEDCAKRYVEKRASQLAWWRYNDFIVSDADWMSIIDEARQKAAEAETMPQLRKTLYG